MPPMNDDEIKEFLVERAHTAKVATTRRDGRPHVAPVWFVLDGADVLFTTGAETVKGKSLAREGRAALCVDDDEPPFSFAIVEGTVTLSEELDDLRHWATRIGARYMGDDRAEEYGRRNGVPGELLVRLTPTKMIGEHRVAD